VALVDARVDLVNFGQQGIRVNGILVTRADNAFDPQDPEHIRWLDRFALGRVVQVDEIARLAVFLASPAQVRSAAQAGEA